MRYLVLNHRIIFALVASRGIDRFSTETEKLLETFRGVGTLTLSSMGQMEFGSNLGISVPDEFDVEAYIFTPYEGAFLPAATFNDTAIVEVSNEMVVHHPFLDEDVKRQLEKFGLSVA
jgi:hypothetical protein